MQTSYELALNEFRDASAAVRRAFGAVAEARELQIIADSQHKTASNVLLEAQARLDRADADLQRSREVQPAPEVVDLPVEAPPLGRVTQADIDALANPSWNGAADDQQLRIG